MNVQYRGKAFEQKLIISVTRAPGPTLLRQATTAPTRGLVISHGPHFLTKVVMLPCVLEIQANGEETVHSAV